MLTALLLTSLAVVPQSEEIVARFYCTPERVEVGEPFQLVLEYSHAADVSVFNALAGELELDASWVIFDEERRPSEPDPEHPGRKRTLRIWRVASLQPSEGAPRVLSEVVSRLAFREDVRRIETSQASIYVTSVLGEDDGPRPMAAFPEGFGREAPIYERSPWLAAVGGAMALFWAVFLYLLVRARRRSSTAGVGEPAPLEALALLQAQPTEASDVRNTPDILRDRHYALTRLLRRAFGKALGDMHAGLTDQEWLAAISASKRVSPASVEEASRLIQDAEKIKYGGAVPSHWALQETFAATRRVLESLNAAPEAVGGVDAC